MAITSTISTCLWFDGQAEEAANLYTSLFPDSQITNVTRPAPERTPLLVEFTLCGTPFQALNGGPQYTFSEAISLSVTTENQEETDRLWTALIAEGGSEGQCGWLKDRFGLSWQIVPRVLPQLIGSSDRAAAQRALQAMMGMKKIEIAALEAAYRGAT